MISTKINNVEIDRLKQVLSLYRVDQSPPTNRHEILRVNDKGIFLVLYSSGKLVYRENNETKKIIEQVLNIMPDQNNKKHNEDLQYDYRIGSDEAGKGEWYGPLVVVSVAIKSDQIPKIRQLGVQDSKALSPDAIFKISNKLKESNIIFRSVVLPPAKYNSLVAAFKNEGKNLNHLLSWAHSAVIKDIVNHILNENPDLNLHVTVDKFDESKMAPRLQGIDKNVVIIQKTSGEQETAVAAASILAKNIFEQEIHKLNTKFGINIKTITPAEIPQKILPMIAKVHFKNIRNNL